MARRDLNSTADAVERLVRIAITYCHFAAANKNLWRALFEHQMANEKPVPTWFVEEQMRLFEHPSAPLRLLMSEAEEPDVAMMSRTLFAAVHGVVLFGIEERMISVPVGLLEQSIENFVRLTCEGLLQRRRPRKGKASP
jgi:Tetracyclin repressor-like, C-terminal domain